MLVIKKVNEAKTRVTEIFPVTFAYPGTSPNKLFSQIKKNTVNK
jgi:hypothetical protein